MIDRDRLVAHARSWRALQEMLATRAVTVGVPDGVLSEVTVAAVGEPARASERILLGEINEVHAVVTPSSREFVVRISRGRPHFEDERWAIRAAAAADVPVPSVLHVEQREVGEERVEICVQERLPGRPLDHVLFEGEPPDDADIRRVLANTGDALSRLHGIVVDGFGHPDSTGRARDPGWSFFLGVFCRNRDRSRAIAEDRGLEGRVFDKAADLLEAQLDIYDGQPPRLVHGDLHPKHVLVSDAYTVSGFIDFEACRGGDPIYDLAAWDYLQRDTLPLSLLLHGYERRCTLAGDWELRLGIYRVLLGLAYVIVAGGRMPLWAELGRRHLPEDVETLS